MWGTKTESRHRWQCGAVVRGGDARGRGRRFESRRPCSREFYAKNAGDGRALAGRGLHWLKKFPFFSYFLGFFFIPTLPCRVPNKKHSSKTPLPAHFLPSDLYRVQHSVKLLPSAALGKAFAECKLGSVKPLSPVGHLPRQWPPLTPA